MLLTLCDRCKAPNDVSQGIVQYWPLEFNEFEKRPREVDLCQNCRKDFEYILKSFLEVK
jgi:hypothetical protein